MLALKSTAKFHESVQLVMSLKIKDQWSHFHPHLAKAGQKLNTRSICALCHQGNLGEGVQLTDIYTKQRVPKCQSKSMY